MSNNLDVYIKELELRLNDIVSVPDINDLGFVSGNTINILIKKNTILIPMNVVGGRRLFDKKDVLHFIKKSYVRGKR